MHLIKISYYILFVYCINAEIKIEFANMMNPLLTCINVIQEVYLKDHTLLISATKKTEFVFAGNNNEKTITSYSGLNYSVPSKFWKFNNFIFIIENPMEMDYILKSLYGTQLWNSRGKYIISYNGQDRIDEIFSTSWQYYIFNINVVTPTLKNNFQAEIYTFYPYKNNVCGQFLNYELLASCSNNMGDIFPPKIPLDLGGCQLKMMAYPMIPYVLNIKAPREHAAKAGIEIAIIHVLSQRMNFTENYIPHNHAFWGFKDLSGIYRFMFGSLYNKECDLTLGMQFGNASHVVDFDGGFVHLIDTSVWWAPIALPIAQWKNLTTIFNGVVWLAILIAYLANGIAFWLTGHKRESTDSYNDIVLCIMSSLYSLLQGSVESPNTWILRSIFIIWLMSCVLLFTAYQSQLVSILTSPLYDHQIDSLEEVVNSSLGYGMFVGAALAFGDPTNWVHAKMMNNYFQCPLSNFCLNRTAYERDFVALRNLRNSRYFIPRLYTSASGKVLVHRFEYDSLGIWVRFYTTKGFPWLDRINNLIMLLASNGLIAKWDSDASFYIPKIESDPDHAPLKLDHLQGAFYILSFGVSSAVFVLLCEFLIIFFRTRNRINREKLMPYQK